MQPWEKPMDWNVKQLGPLLALTMVGLGSKGFADAEKRYSVDKRYFEIDKQNQLAQCMDSCCPPPEPPAPCYSIDTCPSCPFCLGPEVVAGNPAVRPYVCNGDLVLTFSAFYWKAQQDGLAYGINTSVPLPTIPTPTAVITPADSSSLNNIIDARYLNPKFKWDLGFKLGFGYDLVCDGWDINLLWTNFRGRASSNCCDSQVDSTDNRSLLPLWSDFTSQVSNPVLFATQINAHWKLKLNLADFELGREFWNSKYLTLRPHMGLRFAWIKQTFDLLHQGGSWSAQTTSGTTPTTLVSPTNNEVKLRNKFKGVGLRGGLDSVWHICHGFSLFGNAALSIVYGRFKTSERERNRLALSPFGKTPVLESSDSFRSSKGIADLAFGANWATMFCDCRYRFQIALAWENHLFFDQNQLWRVNKMGSNISVPGTPPTVITQTNAIIKQKGDLGAQGWTLTLLFDF